ncbi:hypothetical protein SAMN06265171_106314 [Chryseobacterium rhizoplanae]|uniref:Uncharacterized protein n=1 Tax=Chryseobacterium rhizoplanae TaxID=1609531 RepID=A0A521E2J1_9FLAO|nr:hypothetical protein SAMN06265171_106314 [Chryseobacterium rhizoplanae]
MRFFGIFMQYIKKNLDIFVAKILQFIYIR